MKAKKSIFSVIFVLILTATMAIAANTVNFNGNVYNLSFSAKGAGGGFYNEYNKKGQSVKDWNELVVVHQFPNAKSPLVEAKKVASVVTAIYAKQSKKAPVAVSYNDKKDEAIVDFILPVPDEKNQSLKCLEFNVFKYQKAKNGKGLVAFQYAKRFYPNELKQEKVFQEDLVKTRKTILPAMAEVVVPSVVERVIK